MFEAITYIQSIPLKVNVSKVLNLLTQKLTPIFS